MYIEHVARRWVADGNTVTLCCAAVGGHPARETVHGVDIVRSGNRFTVYRHARRFVARQRQFDVIVECVNTKPFQASRVAGSTPVVAFIHQVAREVWWYEAPLPAAAIGRFVLEPLWLRQLRDIPTLTVSASSRDSLVAYGIRNVSVVPMGIESPDRSVHAPKATVPTLAFCGRLVRSKRPDHAVAALRHLRVHMPEARLVIIGSGPMARRLARRSHPGLELTGRCSQATKQQIMASAHALIATSVREGWGLVVSEAAAVGTPTAGYDVAGLRDSIAAGAGITTSANPAALADALATALPAWMATPPRPIRWGGAASWDDTSDAVLAALRQVITGTRTASMRPRARTAAGRTPDGVLEGAR